MDDDDDSDDDIAQQPSSLQTQPLSNEDKPTESNKETFASSSGAALEHCAQNVSRSVSPEAVPSVLNHSVAGPTLAGEAVPVALPPSTRPAVKKLPAAADQIHGCTPAHNGASSDSDSDCTDKPPSTKPIPIAAMNAHVRKNQATAFKSIKEKDSNEHTVNKKREAEAEAESAEGVEGGDALDQDNSDDTGETAPAADSKKSVKHHAKKRSKANVVANKKQSSKELPSILPDRPGLLDDVESVEFKKRVLVVLGGRKTGGTTQKTLYELNKLLALDDAKFTRLEIGSVNVCNEISKHVTEDSEAVCKWGLSGVIEPFPISSDKLLYGIDDQKTASFVSSMQDDQNALNHLRAATMEIRRSSEKPGSERYSMLMRVKPLPPETGEDGKPDEKAQIFYENLCTVMEEDKKIELCINVSKKTMRSLIELPNADVFFTNMLLFHELQDRRIVKRALGDDAPSFSHVNFDSPDSMGGNNNSWMHAIATVRPTEPAPKKPRGGGSKAQSKLAFLKHAPATTPAQPPHLADERAPDARDGAASPSPSPGRGPSTAPPPPAAIAPVAPVALSAPVAPVALFAPVAPVAPPPTPSATAPPTTLSFYNPEQQGADFIGTYGVVPYVPPPGSGYESTCMFGNNVECWKTANGRWHFGVLER